MRFIGSLILFAFSRLAPFLVRVAVGLIACLVSYLADVYADVRHAGSLAEFIGKECDFLRLSFDVRIRQRR